MQDYFPHAYSDCDVVWLCKTTSHIHTVTVMLSGYARLLPTAYSDCDVVWLCKTTSHMHTVTVMLSFVNRHFFKETVNFESSESVHYATVLVKSVSGTVSSVFLPPPSRVLVSVSGTVSSVSLLLLLSSLSPSVCHPLGQLWATLQYSGVNTHSSCPSDCTAHF